MIRFLFVILLTLPLHAQEPNPFLQHLDLKKPLETLNALEAAKQKLWEAMPLAVKRAVFVIEEPQGYGLYKVRQGTEYSSQEPIHIYVELLGQGFKELEGLQKSEIALDFFLKTKAGKPILRQENFNTISSLSHSATKELFLSLSYTFNGLEAGDYLVITTIRDKATGKQTELDSTFTITK